MIAADSRSHADEIINKKRVDLEEVKISLSRIKPPELIPKISNDKNIEIIEGDTPVLPRGRIYMPDDLTKPNHYSTTS